MIVNNLDHLKPGMVLAEPVLDVHHGLLLKAGVMLDERRIRLLKSWGVNRVMVAGHRADAPDPLPSPAAVTSMPQDSGPPTGTRDDLFTEVLRVAAILALERQQRDDTGR